MTEENDDVLDVAPSTRIQEFLKKDVYTQIGNRFVELIAPRIRTGNLCNRVNDKSGSIRMGGLFLLGLAFFAGFRGVKGKGRKEMYRGSMFGGRVRNGLVVVACC